MVRTRSSLPANRVYSSPLPQQQLKFPARRQQIKREISDTSKELLKQSTLTQIGYVGSEKTMEELDAEVDEFRGEERTRKSKRRRTYGGESSSSSRHHTQTLTQIDNFLSVASRDDEDVIVRESPEVSPSQSGGRRRFFQEIIEVEESQGTQNDENEESSRTYSPSSVAPQSTQCMPPPHTPAKSRIFEVPSSQSPATPFSNRSMRSASRSPLKEKSANQTLFTRSPAINSSPQKLPKLEIEDTYEWENALSQSSRVPTSPSKRSSPKSVRFAARPDSVVPSTPTCKLKREPHSSPVKKLSSTITKTEILDSDDEDSDEYEEPDEEANKEAENYDEEEPETCYGNFGVDTQIHAAHIISTQAADAPEAVVGKIVTLMASHSDTQEPFTFTRSSQAEESQRLPKHELDALSGRTARSDIIMSIYPGHMDNMANGSKDHEFRDWSIPTQVNRVWFYETKPSSRLRYMAVIGPAKRPGEIKNLKGLGNKEFNAAVKPNRRAYEILKLYQLAQPISLQQLIRNEVIRGAPQRFTYLLPATLNDLMSQLERQVLSLRGYEIESRTGLQHASSDSQEAEAQLQSTLQQFTPKRDLYSLPRSSQATTVDLSQPETPLQAASIQRILDSPTVQIPESQDLPLQEREMAEEIDDMVPFSLGSSQLLTKSQMLPASLMEDSGPLHPLYIEDSQDEDEML